MKMGNLGEACDLDTILITPLVMAHAHTRDARSRACSNAPALKSAPPARTSAQSFELARRFGPPPMCVSTAQCVCEHCTACAIVVVTGCWPYLEWQPSASDVPALFRVLDGSIRTKIVERPLLC